MKKRLLSLILVLLLCVTLAPVAAASTTAENNSVSVGYAAVVITANKDLYFWGAEGRTGILEPQKVLSNVEFASTNGSMGLAVAITTSKDLYVWGGNVYGQAGNGSSGRFETQRNPFKVLSNVASVTSDGYSVAAITTNGDLYTWGRNQYGQLGNGKSGQEEIQSTPKKVLSNIASVAMSKGTNNWGMIAAVATNGDLYTWGRNDYGQVGNGKSGDGEVQKTPVKILSNVASLPSNEGHGAAITTNGDLYTWGTNWFGQVGTGTRTHQTTPVKVLSDVVSVFTSSTTLAITTNGDLYGWGYTEMGQVGNGKQFPEDSQTTPVKVLSNVVSVTASHTNTAAITTNGDLYCWGEGGDFQIGNESFRSQATPFKVLSNVASFTNELGSNPAAVTKNGDLYTWGNNLHGQIGNGEGGMGSDPLNWGIKQKVPVKVLSNVVSASIIDSVSSALTKNGDLYTWGFNEYASVGNGTKTNQTTPVKVLSNVLLSNSAAQTPEIKVAPTPEIKAAPTASKVLVDGKNVSFEAYNIAGNNYFKLRDLAKVVSGTGKQFAVGYDNATKAITLTSGNAYTATGSELSKGDGKAKTATTTTSKVYVDGKETPFMAYNIGGNNYFKLGDLAKVFDFGVGWNGVTNTITIDTSIGYTK
ncbi:Alpha-tubulin suppressor [Natronincola peptidivorans]|uniref:Alpha-tubulin suppressor n=1 Tax=Natronincola peptidivorans TaxID=426128 RepID=A0A1I0HCR5_9FIRM|nr:RCC1 domain-containing protein [Natronincola peptidivorans]SET81606.1 Alpha-tubulin suppressor [Natronincola peptidivorans]